MNLNNRTTIVGILGRQMLVSIIRREGDDFALIVVIVIEKFIRISRHASSRLVLDGM
jgi:hypothetical protein